MLKFNEQKQIESVNGALALRNQINELIDGICKEGYKNICWLGIGGMEHMHLASRQRFI